MSSFNEKYWRYSLFTLIIVMGAVILLESRPYLGGVLGAATLYVLLRRQVYALTHKYRWRRSIATTLLLLEAIFCFLVPLSLVVWLVVDKVQILVADPSMVVAPLTHLADVVRAHTGYNVWQPSNVESLVRSIPQLGQWAVTAIADFTVNIIVLLFVLYFMLIGGRRMERYVARVLPFSATLTPHIMRQMHLVVRLLLQKKMADIHPIITIFGVIVGLSLFGFMEVIFGPLVLAMFALCVDIFKKIYLDGIDETEVFSPSDDAKIDV